MILGSVIYYLLITWIIKLPHGDALDPKRPSSGAGPMSLIFGFQRAYIFLNQDVAAASLLSSNELNLFKYGARSITELSVSLCLREQMHMLST